MLRIPNPGSDIDGLIRIFYSLVDEFETADSFNLDAMSHCLTKKNFATSSGYMGREALQRSTRKKRSLDPLYNQSKMYSELFRVLGWMQSLPENHLQFRITQLGLHVRSANVQPKRLVEVCLLGMAFPNPQVRVKTNQSIRPFACILRAMSALGGYISRDEMIVGPLTMTNDRSPEEFDKMVRQIKSCRLHSDRLAKALHEVSKKREIRENTLLNYTRFPISVLKWSSWIEATRNVNSYGRPSSFLMLTSGGRYAVSYLEKLRDVRAGDLVGLELCARKALIRLCFYRMLDDAGFDISSVQDTLKLDYESRGPQIENSLGTDARNILFSPFQELSSDEVFAVLPTPGLSVQKSVLLQPLTDHPERVASGRKRGKVHLPLINVSVSQYEGEHDNSAGQNLRKLRKEFNGNVQQIVNKFVDAHKEDNQSQFYPLVSQLFSLIDFPCRHSRAGVNYQRWDAMISDDKESIPIEIKSPGEETFLSVKAVRQALENKIILLSRSSYPTTEAATSLVVGFNYPNDRSEMESLIYDISSVYGIKIGVIDFRSLVTMATKALLLRLFPKRRKLITLIGFADVENP